MLGAVLIGAIGCGVPAAPEAQGVMTLCIKTDDTEDITIQITAEDDEGHPVTDDTTGQPYRNYLIVDETAPHSLPNDCNTKKPHKAVNMRAESGTVLHVNAQVAGVRSSAQLECIFLVNGAEILATRGRGRNSLSCLYTGRV